MIILSISDVITNSSSEVFVMKKDFAEYFDTLENTNDAISISHIDLDWILSNILEYKMICEICKIPVSEVLKSKEWIPKKENWEKFCNKYIDKLKNSLIGYYFVNIEDYLKNADEVIEEAYNCSIWNDSRH